MGFNSGFKGLMTLAVGNEVNVHNIVLGKCVEFIYAVVSDSGKLWH